MSDLSEAYKIIDVMTEEISELEEQRLIDIIALEDLQRSVDEMNSEIDELKNAIELREDDIKELKGSLQDIDKLTSQI